MNNKDCFFTGGLVILATFIWMRDTTWMSSTDDTLPILISLPVLVWIGWPWSFRPDAVPLDPKKLVLATVCFLAGLVTNLTILLAGGWTLLLWCWLSSRLTPDAIPSVRKLLILPMMAFPWVTLDAQAIGWWFRLSGATITANLFAWGGLDVIRDGTLLSINGTSISIEPACSGLNTLQSMLIAGSVVAYLQLGHLTRYWWNLCWLPIMAWIANTIRIIAICLAGVAVSPEFAMGPFHDIGGWAILVVMFSLCWVLFEAQQETTTTTGSESPK